MRERMRQLTTAYRMTAQTDPRLPLWMVLGFLVPVLLGVLGALLVGPLFVWLPFGFLFGLLGASFVFGRKVQGAQIQQIEGVPGAAAAVMDQLRGQWFVTPAVAVNRKQDMVHRTVGRCGVVLVGEGSSPSRVKQMLAKERTRHQRIVGDAPLHTILIGDGEDDTTELSKLQSKLTRLSPDLSKTEVPKLARRVAGLDKDNIGMPKGYIPPGGRPR